MKTFTSNNASYLAALGVITLWLSLCIVAIETTTGHAQQALDPETLTDYDALVICATDECPDPVILPPCPTEDSDNCFWDSRQRGNGIGESFYVLDGVVTFYYHGEPA